MSQETLGEGEGRDAAWVRGYHAEQVDGGRGGRGHVP